ncbi:hypothetical protein ACIA74_44105 [Streptomyces sp. NPDC051658]|uniref:hypothetical protein n=1 Tax=Streptomyces sp. NPDC051658 TaxID=3365667 RepID=UPI0037B41AD0
MQGQGAAGIPLGQPGDLLDEGLPQAGSGWAYEPPDQQVYHGAAAGHRRVGQASPVPAVDPPGQ